jgi:hypothetical protein
MLGEILLRAGIATRAYNAISQWLSWLPGGLMHANVGTCAMFAATSGSSVAGFVTALPRPGETKRNPVPQEGPGRKVGKRSGAEGTSTELPAR